MLCRYCGFLFWTEGLSQPCLKQVNWLIFPTAFSYFVSLCLILEILALFQTFSWSLYVLWWSVISDLWCSFIIWGLHKPHPISVLSHFSCVHLFATPCIVAHQAPLSMGFSMPEYWSGLSFPSTGHLPNPGIESSSLIFPALAERFFTTSTTWEVPYKAVKSIDKCSDYSTPRLLPTSLFL